MMTPQHVTKRHIAAMCQRTFGPAVSVTDVQELSGGTFNTTYLLTLAERQVILRVAPAPTATPGWDDAWLMRREHAITPFFAAIAPLLPQTVMADFTHQLLDRDYIFQTVMEGESWDDTAAELTPAEDQALWQQFGSVLKTIHSTVGERFGSPLLEQHATWSAAVVDRFTRIVSAISAAQLDTGDITRVLNAVRAQTGLLDEITQPRLLHGDLWLFNMLVQRGADGPRISAVLDHDRAWWGDPLADWTMFVLAKSASAETQRSHAAFWRAYGQTAQTPSAIFRAQVYEAMHIGSALAHAAQHGDEDTLARGRAELWMLAAAFEAAT